MVTPKHIFWKILNRIKFLYNPNSIKNMFPSSAENDKIFIAITSCKKNRYKRELCRETWLKDLPKNVNYSFFIGVEDDEEYQNDEEDVICLNVNDEYNYLPAKVLSILKFVNSNIDDYNWFCKCDDDTFIRVNKLQEILIDTVEAVGRMSSVDGTFVYGGAGYFMRKNIVDAILYTHDKNVLTFPDFGIEDTIVSKIVSTIGYTWTNSDLLNQSFVENFDGKPELITNHHCI